MSQPPFNDLDAQLLVHSVVQQPGIRLPERASWAVAEHIRNPFVAVKAKDSGKRCLLHKISRSPRWIFFRFYLFGFCNRRIPKVSVQAGKQPSIQGKRGILS